MKRGLVIALSSLIMVMSIFLFNSCIGLNKFLTRETKERKAMEVTKRIRKPYNDRLQFSGYEWGTKSSDARVGPGPNYFSDKENVWVDEQERLHMQITQSQDRWYCAEVISEQSFGYGTYRFYIDNRTDDLDSNVVLGLFTWSDEPAYNHREIDIECSRWGDMSVNAKNAQFVVQPYNPPGKIMRFQIAPSIENSVHSFTWMRDKVLFQSIAGSDAESSDSSKIIKQWTCTKGIPQAGGENARINLWLVGGKPPKGNGKMKVIISKFEFAPLK